jgi:predicted nucleic acid-binding protein
LGRPIPSHVLWIATAWIRHDLVRITNDSHFARCPRLAAENWLQEVPP